MVAFGDFAMTTVEWF